MATVIDIDSYFEPGDDWLRPYPRFAAELPKPESAKLRFSRRLRVGPSPVIL